MALITATWSFQYGNLIGAQNVILSSAQAQPQGTASAKFSGPIPNASTNLALNIQFPHASLQSFFLTTDQAVTVKVNSTGSPSNTFTLAAGASVAFYVGGGTANPFSVDVIEIYVTNASGQTANLFLEAVYNA